MEKAFFIRKRDGLSREDMIDRVCKNRDSYYRLAYVYMKDHHDSMDAVEDMILVLMENIHKLRKSEAFDSWSKKILVNICKKTLKKRKSEISLEDIYSSSDGLSFEDSIAVKQGIRELKPKYIEAIKLRYYLQLDYKSIGEILGIPVGTAKSRVSIGLKKLEKAIGGDFLE